MSSRARVFEISELFELILLQLPPRDLLLAMRISKAFSTFIATSPAIQSALFFRPLCTTHSQPSLNTLTYEINPLLNTAFPGFLSSPPDIPEKDWDLQYGHFPNPPSRHDSSSTALYLRSAWSLRPEAFARKDASWRRMLVCQPPARRLTLINKFDGDAGTTVDEGSIELPDGDGVRMYMLYDYLYLDVAACEYFRPTFSTWMAWDKTKSVGQRRSTLWLKVNHYFECTPQREEKLDLYRSEGFKEVKIRTVEKWGQGNHGNSRDQNLYDFMTWWTTNYETNKASTGLWDETRLGLLSL